MGPGQGEFDIMADPSRLTQEDLARQARQHIDSLRAAGLEWLPSAPGLETAPILESATETQPTESTSSLFQDLSGDAPPGPADPGTELSLAERRQALEVLAQTVSTCTRCPGLAATRTQTVFGVGQPGVEVCFVGEAPGADEDAQGEPFVGAAGQLLNRIIAACGLKREEVYICNIIKCRPPGNRTPNVEEAAHCREWLEKQLDLIRPRFICALGSTAAKNLLATEQSLGKLRCRFHDFKGTPVICTYHPAYLLPHRNPDKKKEVWEDMKMLMARMGRPVK
jgi:uracil-DNA glycosylase family 4